MAQLNNIPISVVILSHNRLDEIKKVLDEHCMECDRIGYELIIIDNASTDGSRDILIEYKNIYPSIKCVLNDNNFGVSGGRNSGYALASGEFILSMDEDAHIKPSDIIRLKVLLTSLPEVGILSPKILHYITGEQQNSYGNQRCEVGNFHGACYMFRKSLLDEIGYLDELCSFGGEELDYSIRVRSHGYSVLYIPDIEVRHNNYKRTGQVGNERLTKWLYNFIRIYYKYLPVIPATLFATRYFVSYIISCLIARNFIVLLKMIWIAYIAVKDGISSRTFIPDYVIEFYLNPLVRPDIGNVPIWFKVCRSLRGRATKYNSKHER
jgi:GT2 family glycosyltransferase